MEDIPEDRVRSRSNPDSWSVIEIVEHVAIVDDSLSARIAKAVLSKEVIVVHPMLGTISGYEAFLLVAAHPERHLSQIREIHELTKGVIV